MMKNIKAACSVELCYFCVQQLRKMATARSFGDMVQAFAGHGNLPDMFISSVTVPTECGVCVPRYNTGFYI